MVADTLIYHPTLTKLIALLNKTAGRDKAFRLLQYLARFLSSYVAVNSGSLELARWFKQLQGQFAFIRKGLRCLKPLNHLQDAARAFDNKLSVDPVVRLAAVLKNLAYVGYLSLDSLVWLKMLGAVASTKFPKAGKYASWFWFIGLLSGLTSDARKIFISSSKLKSLASSAASGDEKAALKDTEELKKTQAQRAAATKKLVWDSLDTFIVLNSLGFLHNPETQVGLAGSITAFLGLQEIWDSIKV